MRAMVRALLALLSMQTTQAVAALLGLAILGAGCTGEFRGLGPDPEETGAMQGIGNDAEVPDGAAEDASASDASARDRDAPDAGPPDAASPSADGNADDASSSDAMTGQDADGASDDGMAAEGGPGDAGAPEAGCGATDTIASCGACGQACDTQSGAPTCDGRTCSYACNTGYADCNGAMAPDTDGCECATPECCGASCQTAHSNGVGQTYYDCDPPGALGSTGAMAACIAFAGGDPTKCSDHWYCNNDDQQVCFITGSRDCQTYCWTYAGALAGAVSDCTCPVTKIADWD
jgi:hypothetical protein